MMVSAGSIVRALMISVNIALINHYQFVIMAFHYLQSVFPSSTSGKKMSLMNAYTKQQLINEGYSTIHKSSKINESSRNSI